MEMRFLGYIPTTREGNNRRSTRAHYPRSGLAGAIPPSAPRQAPHTESSRAGREAGAGRRAGWRRPSRASLRAAPGLLCPRLGPRSPRPPRAQAKARSRSPPRPPPAAAPRQSRPWLLARRRLSARGEASLKHQSFVAPGAARPKVRSGPRGFHGEGLPCGSARTFFCARLCRALPATFSATPSLQLGAAAASPPCPTREPAEETSAQGNRRCFAPRLRPPGDAPPLSGPRETHTLPPSLPWDRFGTKGGNEELDGGGSVLFLKERERHVERSPLSKAQKALYLGYNPRHMR